MKNKILDIIQEKPKHYSVIIKRNKELNEWVMTHSLIQSENYIEMIYSAIHQETNICVNGNRKTIARFSDGWSGCGPASKCKCTKDSISKNVSLSKMSLSPESKETSNKKRENTLLLTYGVRFNSQRTDIKKLLSKPKISDKVYKLLTDKQWLENEYVIKERTLVDIADELGVYYGTVGEYCNKFGFYIRQRTNYSREELKICSYLDSLSVDYITNDWCILGNKEIDIFIPSNKIGIEVNGLYWHSYNPYCTHTNQIEDKNRHRDKTTCAENKGVDLIQFTDFEIKNKLDIVKSILKIRLGLSSKIYARECEIRLVPKQEEKDFLSINHIQGFRGSSTAIGLYYKTELVMIMTFGSPRYSKIADIELIRMATKLNIIVVGGANRLFEYAKTLFSGKKIVSYCDRSKFTGKMYDRLGFTANKLVEPGYFWTDGTAIISRHKCQHKSLEKWLTSYDPTKSESENLFSAKYRRYWDCGQQSWIIEL